MISIREGIKEISGSRNGIVWSGEIERKLSELFKFLHNCCHRLANIQIQNTVLISKELPSLRHFTETIQNKS